MGLARFTSFLRQLTGACPFGGDLRPARIRLLRPGGRTTLPFPHPWNYGRPLEILESYFVGAERDEGSRRHNRYLEVPGFAPVLVTRDPAVIRAVTTQTGDRDDQFDRDTLPSGGIARATGEDSLLYANGPTWREQRRASASPFGKTELFQPEAFGAFAETFRGSVRARLEVLDGRLRATGDSGVRVRLEPEIKAIMLELLVTNFFGAAIPYAELRDRHVPALERVIDDIVRDTVTRRLGVLAHLLPGVPRRSPTLADDTRSFDELTSTVLAARSTGGGHWKRFKSEAPDEALRSNIKVFLAGALEATTSFASWAITHLARHAEAQERVHDEVRGVDEYTPEALASAFYFGRVLDETLRLTPSLYFLPRRACSDTCVELADGRKLIVPAGTHLLLDVWHANRHEDHWGVGVTGRPALEFSPDRWEELAARGRGTKETLHFGFGHGPRVCPGKHLGQLEVALVVGAFVKLFRFRAAEPDYVAAAGVSTKPADGVLLDIQRR